MNTSSLTTDNNNGLNGGSINVTVTDANGCSGTASTTVATTPLFPAPIISGDGTICVDGVPVTYTITNFNTAYTYSFPLVTPVSAYTFVTPVTGAGTYTVTWTASAVLSGADISVTATDANGCSHKGTQHFYSCCVGAPGTLNVVNGLSSSLPNPFVGGLFIINGTFTIDNNFTIKGADVLMAPGAKIVIPAAGGAKTLTLTNNGGAITRVFAGCDIMWNSIYIGAGQTLVANNGTRIQDADSAVVSTAGGKYTISNSTLNKNYKHIVVMPYAGTHPGTIEKSNLYCNGYVTLAPVTLLLPYPAGTRTTIGIEIYDVNQITVGNTTSVTLRNNFRNMDIGIRSLRSNLAVFNNAFINIDNPSAVACKTCNCQIGTGICAIGGKTPAHTLIVAGAVSGPIKNIFTGGVNGITAKDNLDVFVTGNSFVNLTGTGVFVTQCSSRLLDVSDNIMNGVINGIDMYENPNAFTMNIANNNINLAGGSFSATISNYAIVVQNIMLNPNNAVITNNTIQKAKTGIWLINSDATLVENNTIIYPVSMVVSGAKLMGIRLERSDNSRVENNTVQKSGGLPTASTELLLRGISVENTQNSAVGKNTLNRVGQGVRMLGACNNATIACNTLFQCWYGLKFDAANVGYQLNSGVAQRNVWFINQGPTKMSGSITSPIEFWYISGPFTNPYVGAATGLSAISFVAGHPAITTNPADVCASFLAPLPPGVKRDQKFGKIVRNEMAYTTTPAEFGFADKEMTFRELKKDPTMLILGAADDIDYQSFYTTTQAEPIGKFEQVNDLINTGNVTTAVSVNNTVTPTTAMETNRQAVNTIYLQTFANGNYDLDPATESALQAIAYLDPLIDGDAVYTARAMLRIDPTDDSTVRSMDSEEEDDGTVQENIAISKVYPNPNNGVMQMDYTIAEQAVGTLIIYDLTGRKLSTYPMNGGTNTIRINESKLDSGIYFYQVIVNNEMVESDKIVIIR